MGSAHRTLKDSDLVMAARSGDAKAYGSLIERHFSAVYIIAVARLRDREMAEDLAQEVFVRAQLHLNQLADAERFEGWVCRMTRNLAIDWLRRGQRASRLLKMVPLDEMTQQIPDTTDKGAREIMASKEQSQTVRDAIMDLPADQREVVLLHFTEELTQSQIAERLGVNQATVSRQIQRALRALRGTLEPVLRETAATFKPQHQAVAKSLIFATAIGAMTASAKVSLAASASVGQWASAAEASAVGAVGAVGFFKSLPALIAAGGKIMATGKGLVATAVAVAAIAGGTYHITHGQGHPPVPVPDHEGIFAIGADDRLIEFAEFTFEEMDQAQDRWQAGEDPAAVFGEMDMPSIPRDTRLVVNHPGTVSGDFESGHGNFRGYDLDQIDLEAMETPSLGEEWREDSNSPDIWVVNFTEPVVGDLIGVFWESEDRSERIAWMARFEDENLSGLPSSAGVYAVEPDGTLIPLQRISRDENRAVMGRIAQGEEPEVAVRDLRLPTISPDSQLKIYYPERVEEIGDPSSFFLIQQVAYDGIQESTVRAEYEAFPGLPGLWQVDMYSSLGDDILGVFENAGGVPTEMHAALLGEFPAVRREATNRSVSVEGILSRRIMRDMTCQAGEVIEFEIREEETFRLNILPNDFGIERAYVSTHVGNILFGYEIHGEEAPNDVRIGRNGTAIRLGSFTQMQIRRPYFGARWEESVEGTWTFRFVIDGDNAALNTAMAEINRQMAEEEISVHEWVERRDDLIEEHWPELPD